MSSDHFGPAKAAPVIEACPALSEHVAKMRQRVIDAVNRYKNDERIPPDFTTPELHAAINALAVEADTNATMYAAWRKRAEEAEAENEELSESRHAPLVPFVNSVVEQAKTAPAGAPSDDEDWCEWLGWDCVRAGTCGRRCDGGAGAARIGRTRQDARK